ncbi:hypothetical protein [Zymomonas mobilis]|nr:hypothetical protein [Zymomonas mobilis]
MQSPFWSFAVKRGEGSREALLQGHSLSGCFRNLDTRYFYNKSFHFIERIMVRAEGLEPSRANAQRIFLPATAFTATAYAVFGVWTIPSPCPLKKGVGAARLVSTPS